ncbi:hypothetical protein [Levilactobacillus bambusae]|nr:hypothetical protein [Levilactobacillus bambusae]
MANTKNSQAAKIRNLIIEWLQDDAKTVIISQAKFPGIRGIRAVDLRQMLQDAGFSQSVVMGAVSAAPKVDARIQKASVKTRQVYYYYSEDGQPLAVPTPSAITGQPIDGTITELPEYNALGGALNDLNTQLESLYKGIKEEAAKRPLADYEVDFLEDFTHTVSDQLDLLRELRAQARLYTLRNDK